MITKEREPQNYRDDLAKIQAFRLMDDDFMTACFDGSPECVELVLRIILGKDDLVVTEVKVQHFIKNLMNRSVKLDVFATDSIGKKYNVEIQRDDKGAGVKRARYNSSLIDSKIMETGTEFADLPESYVIFITEKDVLKRGEPLYHIERCVMETGECFGDESHIIYVNGTYRGDDPLGHLMSDFNCTKPTDMYYNKLKERVKYFKETKEGVATMCKAIEEMRREEREAGKIEGKIEGKKEGKSELLSAMSNNGMTDEKIAEIVAMPLEEVKQLLRRYK